MATSKMPKKSGDKQFKNYSEAIKEAKKRKEKSITFQLKNKK